MSLNRFYSYGLLFGCPFQEEDANCPLDELRKLPTDKRMKNFNELSNSDLTNLEEYHKNCSLRKECDFKRKKP
jgi:hypothetical protein